MHNSDLNLFYSVEEKIKINRMFGRFFSFVLSCGQILNSAMVSWTVDRRPKRSQKNLGVRRIKNDESQK